MSHMEIVYAGSYSTKVYSSENELEVVTDAPKEHGGTGIHLSPTDLFAASLGSCVITVLSMHAKKMQISFEGVRAHVTKNGTPAGGISEIIVEVHYPGSLSKEIQEKLEACAKHCPIHQCIDPKIKQQIIIHTHS